MAAVNITINGQQIQAQMGQTIYEAAAAAGIDIPVLCHHPALPPEGACRICLVEIEKQRNLQPSCTFPVTEGMVVHTESERVIASRKFVLEMIFSERVHYCMYCPLSGSDTGSQCELQRLGYRYGLANWQFAPNYSKDWGVDASRKYFLMDHSRCILCRRCVRACDEIVANHTLGVRERGARTMIIADDDVRFGDSSCISCGTCLQVCPTGALIDRRSAYMGFGSDFTHTHTTCLACPVGCDVDALVRSNHLIRVEGIWDAPNRGLLCVHGRFETVEPQPERVKAPLMRRDGAWAEVSWDEALATVARQFKAAGGVAGLASPRATIEELAAFKALMDGIGSQEAGLIYGAAPADVAPQAGLADLDAADTIVVVAGKPLDEQKVVGYVIRRAAERGARLIVAAAEPNALDAYAALCLGLDELDKLSAEVAAASRPVVLYAADLPSAALAAVKALDKAKFMPLYTGANAAGAARLGLTSRPVQGQALFVLAADEIPDGHNLPAAGFTVVQSAYRTRWTDVADVILPALAWTEKQGHVINLEGRELPVAACIQPPAGVQADVATLAALTERMGR